MCTSNTKQQKFLVPLTRNSTAVSLMLCLERQGLPGLFSQLFSVDVEKSFLETQCNVLDTVRLFVCIIQFLHLLLLSSLKVDAPDWEQTACYHDAYNRALQ